jgi:hypothetical protein
MQLDELLHELRANILHDRSDRFGGDINDEMWTDATLVRYINEAQRRFARRSLILRDGTTPAVTQVTLVAGQSIYPLHVSVLAVISAKVSTAAYDLARAGHSIFDTNRPVDGPYFDPSRLGTLTPGAPVAYSTDEDVSPDGNGSISVIHLRVYPTPDASSAGRVLQLRVARLPINNLTLANMSATPEIPEDHHLEMLDWAAYLALRIVDLDAGMPDRSKEFGASFEAHVALARQTVLRKMFTPQPWGFGRGGWTWEN